MVGLVGAVPGREQSRWEGGREMGGAGEGEEGGRGLRASTGVAENVSGGNHTWAKLFNVLTVSFWARLIPSTPISCRRGRKIFTHIFSINF